MTVQKTGPANAKAVSKRRRWGIALTALVLTALLVGGFRAHRHVRHEANFCAQGCHVPKEGRAAWHTTGHQEAECQSCHTSDARTSFSLLWKKTIGSKELPKHGKFDAAECTHCHEKKPVDWRLVSATEGHKGHRGVKDVTCFSCHAQNAHKEAPQTEKLCLECHKEARLHKSARDAETCISCHAFSPGARRVGKPRAMACGGCHSDPSKVTATSTRVVNDTAVHGSLDCKLCHNPHPQQKPKVAEGQPMCSRCHQIQLPAADQKASPEGHKDCLGCHEPHAQHKTALSSCVKCHETRVKGLTVAVRAPTGANDPLAVLSSGKTTTSALRHESCASCHLPHTWKAEIGGCAECHKDQAQSIKTKSPPQHAECASCHDVHGPPPSGLVCLKCHSATKQDHVAKAPGRHKDCTACHEPHSATRAVARESCGSCHTAAASQLVLGGAIEHAKKGCFGCHGIHESPKPPADLCNKCHQEKVKAVAAAEPAKHKNCASCHQSHRFVVKDVAQTCATCHGQTIQAGGVHNGGACKDCHSIHGTAQVDRKACFACHKPIQAAFKPPAGNEAHNKCRSCHQPHRPAALATTSCGTCHTRQVSTAKTWPASSAHAGPCANCHEPHDAKTRKKGCTDCHAKEAASATNGKHQCAQCHAPHKAAPGAGPAWWGVCADCHQKQAAGVKDRGPQHGACNNCHKSHRFESPTCQSCHGAMSDKGLHAGKSHSQKCDGCHDPHVKGEPSRAQCLSCHKDKQQHEPSAQKCQACHPFR